MATSLVNVFERISNEMKHGDIAEACRRAGVSDQIYLNARKRTSFKDLSNAEHKVIMQIIKILDSRIKDQKKIEASC